MPKEIEREMRVIEEEKGKWGREEGEERRLQCH